MISPMTRPLRILMTTDSLGGVWQHSMELIHGLQQQGHHVHLVSFGRDLSPGQQRDVSLLPSTETTVSPLRLEWMEDPWTDVKRGASLLQSVAERFEPDIIHLNSYALAAHSWDAPVVVGAHSCVFSWWDSVNCENAPSRYNDYRRNVIAGLHAANRVVAPSRMMLQELRRHYDTSFRGLVIPNGIDSSGRPHGYKKPQIFSCGRLWDEAKNISLLDRIAPEVGWPIFVAGEIIPPAGRTHEFSSLTCLGPLAKGAVREEFAKAAIYASPALYEPFGLAILEAALSGCALVLADIPSLREIWRDAAIFVPPRELSAWRQSLNHLIRNPQDRLQLGAKAHFRARHYSARVMAKKYAELYHSLRAERNVTERLAA